MYLSPYYADEVKASAALVSDATLKAKILKVASIPTFIWFDLVAKTPTLGTYLAEASALARSTGKKYLVQIVVYDLPDRDCAALASNGEFSIIDGGLAKYYNYIDRLVAEIKSKLLVVLFVLSLLAYAVMSRIPRCPYCGRH